MVTGSTNIYKLIHEIQISFSGISDFDKLLTRAIRCLKKYTAATKIHIIDNCTNSPRTYPADANADIVLKDLSFIKTDNDGKSSKKNLYRLKKQEEHIYIIPVISVRNLDLLLYISYIDDNYQADKFIIDFICNQLKSTLRIISQVSSYQKKVSGICIETGNESFIKLLDKAVFGIYILQDNKIAYVNDSLADIFGYSKKQMTEYLGIKDLIHRDDITILMKRFTERLNGKVESVPYPYKAIKEDGSLLYLEIYGQKVEFNGKPSVMGTVKDITRAYIDNKAARESEEKIRAIINAPTDSIVLLDKQGTIIECNETVASKFGLSRNLFLKTCIYDYFSREVRKTRKHYINKVFKEGKTVRFEDQRSGNWFDNLFFPIFDQKYRVKYVAIIAREITGKKVLEEQISLYQKNLERIIEGKTASLKLNEKRLAESQKTAKIGSWEYAFGSKELSWSDEIRNIFGITDLNKLSWKKAYSFVHKDDKHMVSKENISRLLKKNKFELKYRIIDQKTGRTKWLQVRGRNKFDGKKRIQKCSGTFQDISTIIKTQIELKESYNTLKTIIDGIDDPVFTKNLDSQYINVNKRFTQVVGRDISDIIGKDDVEIFGVKTGKELMEADKGVISSGKKMKLEETTDVGDEIVWQTQKSPWTNEEGRIIGIIGAARDITDLKKIHLELEQRTEDLNERVKELNCLYGLSELVSKYNSNVYKILTELPDLIAKNWLYTKDTNVRILFDKTTYRSKGFKNCRNKIEEAIIVNKKERGTICVSLSSKPTKGGNIEEEAKLLKMLAERIGRITENYEASWELRSYRANLEDMVKERTRALEMSQASYKGLFDNTSSGIAVYQAVDEGRDFIFTDFNPMSCKMNKLRKNQVIGKKVTKVFPGIKEMGLLKVFQDVYKTGKTILHPSVLYKDDRIEGYRENQVFKLPTGEIVAIYDDVSDIQKSKEELTNINRNLINTQRMARIGQWEVDLKSKKLNWSDELCEMMGYKKGYEPKLDSFLKNLVHKDDREMANAKIAEGLQKGSFDLFEFRTYTKSGKLKHFLCRGEVKKNSAGKAVKITGIDMDVTELRVMEEALKESESKFRSITENAEDCIFIKDKKGRFTFANKAMGKLFGLPPGEIIGKTTKQMFGDRQAKKIQEIDDKAFQKGYVNETQALKVGDETLYFNAIQNTFAQKKGKTDLIMGIVRNVTRERMAQEQLNDSEARYRSTFEQAAVGITHINEKGKYIKVNSKFCRMMGYSRKELLSKKVRDISNREDMKENDRLLKKLINNEISEFVMEKRYIRKNKSVIWGKLTVSKATGPNNEIKYIMAIIEDITKQKKAQEEIKRLYKNMIQSSEMERKRFAENLHDGVGQLINASKINFVTYFRDGDADKKLFKNGLEYLNRASEELRGIYSDIYPAILKDLGLKATIRCDLDNFLKVKHIRTFFTYNVKKEMPEEVTIHIYRIMQEILSNIIKHSKADTVKTDIRLSEKYLYVRVIDNGIGIPVQKKRKGLGLGSIRQRVSNLKGEIQILNRKPGTEIKIQIPRESIYGAN